MKNTVKKLFAIFYAQIKLKEYSKIAVTLQSLKRHLQKFNFKEDVNMAHLIKNYEKHKEILKILIRNEVRFLLVNNSHIKADCLDVVVLISREFEDEIRQIILNDILKKNISDLNNFLELNFTCLKSIEKCFEWHKKRFDKLNLEFSHMPKDWNILGEFTYHFCMLMRKNLCLVLFTKEVKKEEIILSFKNVLEFEQKYPKYYFISECCSKSPIARKIEFSNKNIIINDTERIIENLKNPKPETENQIELYKKPINSKNIFCEHKKMLSQVLAPFLEIYISDLFNEFSNVKKDKDAEEMKILRVFISYFNKIGEIYVKALYFNDDSVFEFILRISDKELKEMISKIGKGKTFYSCCLILNTLNYIKNTYNDLLDRIKSKTNKIYKNISFFEIVKKMEIEEYKFIENIFKNYTKQLILNKPGSKFAINSFYFLEKNIFDKDLTEMHKDILNCIFDLFFSTLFVGITTTKMNYVLAENILTEIYELKQKLKGKVSNIPFINVIERYLKIYLIEPNETVEFVENFFVFSKDTFQFNQILKMLKNDRNNIELFIEFKKESKKEKKENEFCAWKIQITLTYR